MCSVQDAWVFGFKYPDILFSEPQESLELLPHIFPVSDIEGGAYVSGELE
jgi:hypothetical protein